MSDSKENSNKLIAEFIGGINETPKGYILFGCIPDRFCQETHFFTTSEMLFHKSWDWLMPVYIKARQIFQIEIHKHKDLVLASLSSEKKHPLLMLQENILFDFLKYKNEEELKQKIYDWCTEFIEWYNNQ
jgi:hypothetical protein